MFSRTQCKWLFIAIYLNVMEALLGNKVDCGLPCVFVFWWWQGSSADIICICIIIQATASPQGSPAETKPLSICLSPSAWRSLPLLTVVYGKVWHQWWMSSNTTSDWLHGPGSLAVRGFVSALWSHRLVLLECTLSHSDGFYCNENINVSHILKKKKKKERFNRMICQAIWAI